MASDRRFAVCKASDLRPGERLIVSLGGRSVGVFNVKGSYYALHNGHWFHAKRPGAAWVFLPIEKVPMPVIGVPVGYYKIPPGHAKKHDKDGPPMGHPGKGPKQR